MARRFVSRRAAALSALVASACAAQLSCGEHLPDPGRSDRTDSGVATVNVAIVEGNPGTPEQPIPYALGGARFRMRIEARGADNQPLANFNDFVSLSVAPGALSRIEATAGTEIFGRSVKLSGGVGEIWVNVTRAYGEARVWAEEDGYSPAEGGQSIACANGADDDHDGLVDFPADYGCAAPNDNNEQSGSYAIGASDPIFVASPTIRDVQGGVATSPLVNERVTIEAGTLIVTRISIAGFWVTDISDNGYNSIFAFNFRLPEGMRVCDQLHLLQGSVQEFVRTTQFSQPAWEIRPEGLFTTDSTTGCRVPDPIAITPTMVMNADNELEPHESSLVRAARVLFSPLVGPGHPECHAAGETVGQGSCDFREGFSNCDLTNDGVISFLPAALQGTANQGLAESPRALEHVCANQCQGTRGCSEWTNWRRFGQIAVDFEGSTVALSNRLVIAPKDALPTFDPLRPPVPVGTAVTITGTLKQVGPTWIIEPRCAHDFARDANNPPRAQESCVFPRTVTEEP